MQQITLDYKTWRAGISTADGIEDGGYSPLYGGHNLQEFTGDILYPQDLYSLRESGSDFLPTGEPVLYVKSPEAGSSSNSIFGVLIDDENNPYGHTSPNVMEDEGTINSSNIEFRNYGEEDGISFQSDIYIAGDENVALINIDGLGGYSSHDSNWWTSARGHASLGSDKKVLVVVEDTLYICTENEIHIWDGSSSQENALTLPPDFMVTAGLKHPNGRDLILFGAVRDNAGESAASKFRVYYINTIDLEFTDELEMTQEVQGCWYIGGTIYVTSGEWLGIFNGRDVEKLYHLNIDLPDSASSNVREGLIFTIHGTITHQGHLLVPDGNKVLAVGNVGGGTIMWHPFDAGDDMDIVHMVFNIGNKDVGIYGYQGERWDGTLVGVQLDLDDTGGSCKWASNKIRFDQHAWVRRIEIEHETLESGDDFSVGHIQQDGTEVTLRQVTHTKYGAVGKTRIDCNVYTDVFQYLHTWTSGAVGVRKITIWYEGGE